jgi:hypothetical protein
VRGGRELRHRLATAVLASCGPRPAHRRVWSLALAAFFLLGAAWAISVPVDGTYDEKQHLVRAYGVASGQLLPVPAPPEEYFLKPEGFRVPASLVPDDVRCLWYTKPAAASCQKPVTDRTVRPRVSGVARYSPVYYLPVGLPLLASPDYRGVIAARLVSALLGALLLASAVTTAFRLGNRALVAAVALVCTPLAMNLNGSVNPNGLEISAGVLLFTALLALLREESGRRLVWLAGVACAVLCAVRPLGPLLAAVDVAACLVLARPGRVRALLRRRDARWILGGFAGAGLGFAAVWTAVSGSGAVYPVPLWARHLTSGELARQILVDRVPFYLVQAIGQFGYGGIRMAPAVIAGWYLLLGVLVVPALRRGGWRLRLACAGLLAFSAALLVGLDARLAATAGWFAHGRYAMPVAAGVAVAAAFVRGGSRPPWLATGLVAVTAPVHAYAVAVVLARYRANATSPLDAFHGAWAPPAGAAAPLAVSLAGGALLTWLASRTGLRTAVGEERQVDDPAAHHRRDEQPEHPADQQPPAEAAVTVAKQPDARAEAAGEHEHLPG